MSPCPDLCTLDDLSSAERQSHLDECSACRMLFALREGGDEEFSEECESTELLLAVASSSALNEIDERRMTRHLAICARCESLAGAVLLSDAHAQSSTSPAASWKHASEEQGHNEPANDQRSRVLFGLGALAAAAALILIFVSGEKTRPPGPEAENIVANPTSSIDAGFVIVTPEEPTPVPDELEKRPSDTVGGSRPLSVVDLVAQARTLIGNGDFAAALSLCQAALVQEPGHQGARLSCAIAACNVGDANESRLHIAELHGNRAAGVKQICLRLGVVLDETSEDKTGEDETSEDKTGEDETGEDETSKDKTGEDIEQLLAKASSLVKDAQFGAGLKFCRRALKLQPENQEALMTCAIASCNLKNAETAAKYLSRIKSKTRAAGINQICLRQGVTISSSAGRLESLLEEAVASVKDTQYGKGLKLCKQALEIDPNNQQAAMTCVIASCNLKNAASARKYLERITSATRKAGLKQICIHHRVQGFEGEADEEEGLDESDELDEIEKFVDESHLCTLQERPTRQDITSGINKVRAHVTACGERHPDLRGTYKLKLRIATTGDTSVLRTSPEDALGQCVANELRHAKFAESCQGMVVTYPFVFRKD